MQYGTMGTDEPPGSDGYKMSGRPKPDEDYKDKVTIDESEPKSSSCGVVIGRDWLERLVVSSCRVVRLYSRLE